MDSNISKWVVMLCLCEFSWRMLGTLSARRGVPWWPAAHSRRGRVGLGVRGLEGWVPIKWGGLKSIGVNCFFPFFATTQQKYGGGVAKSCTLCPCWVTHVVEGFQALNNKAQFVLHGHGYWRLVHCTLRAFFESIIITYNCSIYNTYYTSVLASLPGFTQGYKVTLRFVLS